MNLHIVIEHIPYGRASAPQPRSLINGGATDGKSVMHDDDDDDDYDDDDDDDHLEPGDDGGQESEHLQLGHFSPNAHPNMHICAALLCLWDDYMM